MGSDPQGLTPLKGGAPDAADGAFQRIAAGFGVGGAPGSRYGFRLLLQLVRQAVGSGRGEDDIADAMDETAEGGALGDGDLDLHRVRSSHRHLSQARRLGSRTATI